MKGYTKEDVSLHRDGFGPGQPAINVKVHHYPNTEQVVDRFGCSEATAERALEYAYMSAQEQFWGQAPDTAGHYFGGDTNPDTGYPARPVYSEGRSDGWLVVPGLEDWEDWNGADLNRWALFERAINADIAYLTSWAYVEGMIDANEWAIDQTAIEGMLVALA